MAQKVINIGTSVNSGGGDALRDAMIKINDNFTELYADIVALEDGQVDTDIKGSVFADDSTLLVDGVNGTISAANLTGTLPALDGSALTGISGGGGLADLVDDTTPQLGGNLDLNNFDITGTGNIPAANLTGTLPALDGSSLTGVTASSVAFADVTATPTTIAGYGITDAFDGVFASLTSKPTTLAGYGITDAATLSNMAPTGAVDFTGATSIDFNTVTINNLEFADISATPTTLAGYGITDSLQLGTSSTTALAGDTALFSGAFADLTSKPTTLAGYGITDAANTSAETTFTADVKFDTGVEEKFATLTGSTGTVTHDCDNGHVFYHTGATGDITANFTNLGLTAEYGTNLTVIINQGATPYEVTAVQIGGVAQTINWQGGLAPTGNASGIDSFSFTILNDGGTYVVLGQMVDFT